MQELQNRKGARKIDEIPPQVLAELNAGRLETVNLTEWLAVDHRILLPRVLAQTEMNQHTEAILAKIHSLKRPTSMQMTAAIGEAILTLSLADNEYESIRAHLAKHRSDSVRGWATYLVGYHPSLPVEEKLAQIQAFAADSHFGVREIAWMAVRPAIARDLEKAIVVLASWTGSPDENIRRFTSEATRPRGVWCKHIDKLKTDPQLARPILEPLHSDPSKYVQDSVGNWLNDASKSRPDWVLQLCEKWLQQSATSATSRIIAKAKRTISRLPE